MAHKNVVGQVFGRLTVSEEVEPHVYPNGRKRKRFLCVCACGNTHTVLISDLFNGKTQSCGCIRSETTKMLKYTHGMAKSRANGIWRNMKSRCYNKKSEYYYCYGGKGVKMCKEWRRSFAAFALWAYQNGYQDNLSIERRDNNGDYTPDNCYWATNKEQANNRSHNLYIYICGERKTLVQWCEALNLQYHKIYQRIYKGACPMAALELL